jgi:hypothetical protein
LRSEEILFYTTAYVTDFGANIFLFFCETRRFFSFHGNVCSYFLRIDPDPAFFVNADPDAYPDPDPGFDDLKLNKIKLTKIFLSKIIIYLSLGLLRARPSYRKGLQPSKENIQHFQT